MENTVVKKKYIVGNWKMNLSLEQAQKLATNLTQLYKNNSNKEVVICPPYVWLYPIANIISGTNIKLGAQNAHYEPNGPYTGEISLSMLRELGCQYVIIGHSERRHGLNESEADINYKVHAVTKNQLYVILCVGESLLDRERKLHELTVQRQLFSACAGLSEKQLNQMIIAYEPVWSIGTGRTASLDIICQMHEHIRRCFEQLYNNRIGDRLPILYGGSVTHENSQEILSSAEIDGVLVGGASLDLRKFAIIINSV